jgi:hypothetical protein
MGPQQVDSRHPKAGRHHRRWLPFAHVPGLKHLAVQLCTHLAHVYTHAHAATVLKVAALLYVHHTTLLTHQPWMHLHTHAAQHSTAQHGTQYHQPSLHTAHKTSHALRIQAGGAQAAKLDAQPCHKPSVRTCGMQVVQERSWQAHHTQNPGFMIMNMDPVFLTSTGSVRSSLSPTSQ